MAKPLLTDELWAVIEPLLPPPKPKPKGGRPPIPNRNALTGILFVLKTGIGWEDLPQEMGCGSGMTCWRRLRDWQKAGVWKKLHSTLLAHLNAADQLDWSRAIVDSGSVRAVFGGPKSAQTRQIGEKTAPNTTRSQMRMAFRSLFSWPVPIAMMSHSCFRWLMRFRLYVASRDRREVGRIVCKGIAHTTRTVTAERCAHVVLFLHSPAGTQITGADWESRAGWSNVRFLGFISFVAFGFDTNVGQISMSRS
jgi:transposase